MIRNVSIDDLDQIMALAKESEEKIAPQGFYTKDELRGVIDSGTYRPFLVAADNDVVGFLIGLVDINRTGYILYLAVSKKHRNKGIGKALVKESLKRFKSLGAKTLFITVEKRNKVAQEFYIKLGFNKVVESILLEKEL